MKISDKLLKKYATVSPMLPPSDEEVLEEVVIPTSKVPVIEELSDEEMRNWEHFIERKKFDKKLEHFRDESLKDQELGIGEEAKAPKEEGTMPAVPHRKADLSPDTLLKMCGQYDDMCHKF